MRSSLGAPHSTERCKITKFLPYNDAFARNSFAISEKMGNFAGGKRSLVVLSFSCFVVLLMV